MTTISACLIVRNEAKTLRNCLDSIRNHVDEICIVDTGSSDESPEIAREFADKWEQFTECNDSEGRIRDFSAARNRNLRQATCEAVLWLDGDDIAHGSSELRKLASEAARGRGGAFSILARYDYDTDASGRVVTLQWRERLVGPPGAFEWRFPVHESLLGRPDVEPVVQMTDRFWVEHRRRSSGKAHDPQRNLRILSDWFRRHGESDARLMHYYAAELLGNQRIGEALYWYRRHINVAPWSDERCLSLLQLAKIQLAIGDNQEAARYALDASATKSWAEPCWVLGQAFAGLAEQGIESAYNYQRAAHYFGRGFRIAENETQTPTLLMVDPMARYDAHAWYSATLAKLGMLEQAIKEAEKCVAGIPEHETARKNLEEWRAERARQQVRGAMVDLHRLGKIEQDAGQLVEAALTGSYKLERVRPATPVLSIPPPVAIGAATSGGKMRIAFWLGHQLEPWTPDTLRERGMGGSETMAWEMARRMAALEHEVTVFGHCEPQASQIYEGVLWLDATLFPARNDDGTNGYDVLIVSRQSEAVMQQHAARVRVLWVHDVHCGPGLTPAIASRYDFVWCLSEWHKQHFCSVYPWLAPKKVEVTRNGIDLGRFDRRVTRHVHRAIYSSSPDRGLITAVRAWSSVREQVPGAELHCYYGFENWERSLELGGENGIHWCSRAALEELKALVASTPGVVMHGRVNPEQLAEAMLSSSVWCYPTWFAETSCITAMEAQAAGLHCVCPSLAALSETVRDVRIWSGDLVADMQQAFSLPRPEHDVARFVLGALAREWEARLRTALDSVVPAFAEVQP